MAGTLHKNRLVELDREAPTAIGGDYLTEDQAAALRSFIERLASTPRKVTLPRNEAASVKRNG